MNKIELKSIFGVVLFSQEKEHNTILATVSEAIKHVSLQRVNLRGADLSRAFLF